MRNFIQVSFCLLASGMLVSNSYAAVLPMPLDRPIQRPSDVPPASIEEKDQPEFKLPPVEMPPSPELSKSTKLKVKQFVFKGTTVISDADIRSVTDKYFQAPYFGVLSSTDLQQIRADVTKWYIDNHYINSGVLLPDQKVEDGIVYFQVIEGKLEDISVRNSATLNPQYIKSFFSEIQQQVVNTANIREKLFVLQTDPRIRRIKANLIPADKLGLAKLILEIEEETRSRYSWALNNHRPPSVGAETVELVAINFNVSGAGDVLDTELAASEGANRVSVTYEYPVRPAELNIIAGLDYNESEILQEPFRSLDIQSKLYSIKLGLDYYHLKTGIRSYKTALTMEWRESQDKLGGENFSFNESSDDGNTKISVGRLSQSWLNRYDKDIVAVQYTFSVGMDKFDSSASSSEPDALFRSFIAQFLWSHALQARTSEVIIKSNLQLASDPLYSMEQYALGGVNSVRGYRENQFVKDSGWLTSIEYRHQVWRSLSGRQRFTMSAFGDYGEAKNKSDKSDAVLSSIGVGLSWKLDSKYQADLYVAEQLKDIETGDTDYDLQDDGIHFEFKGNM